MTVPGVMTAMTNLGFLSPDSICHSFDEKANGYARGEGASFVILKPLDQAIADGDMIRGVIRNTAVNQDGNTPGITVPSATSQENMIKRCYADAGLSLADTQFAEAHGTGTQQGDPKECQALSNCFGKSRSAGDPLLIGSIKSNIGHLEGASGLAQLTKAIFTLEKAEIAPNIWYDKPNPRIPMDEWNLKVVTKLTPWPSDGLRRISINSFGYGGTNAHAIIDDAYNYLALRGLKANHNTITPPTEALTPSADSAIDMSTPPSLSRGSSAGTDIFNAVNHLDYMKQSQENDAKLFILSSNESSGIQRQTQLYSEYLKKKLESQPEDQAALLERLARTLAKRRSVHPWRSFVVASSAKELVSILDQGLAKPKRNNKTPKLGFVFTGQGAQWHAMGRELNVHPVFRHSLEAASLFLLNIGSEWSLLEEFAKDEKDSRINDPELSQPLCTALQMAMVDLFESWGIKPSAVVGHSSGEIGAAYAKGALTKEDAWTIAFHRGRLSQNIHSFDPALKGCMLAVGLSASDCKPYLNAVTQGQAVVACKNSPTSTTLSGDLTAISELEKTMSSDGVFARKLKVTTAYHSPHMNVIAEHYLSSINHIQTQAEVDNDVRMFSSVTGKEVKNEDLGPSYWVKNMVSYVNFVGALNSLNGFSTSKARRSKKAYCSVLVELGPHGALQGPMKEICKEQYKKEGEVECLAVLTRGKDACDTSLNAVGKLFQLGYQANISEVNNDQATIGNDPILVDIPPFPWNRQNKYWSESQVSKNYRFRKHPRTDLLGNRIPEMNSIEPTWRNILKLNEVPWIEHHKVQGTILYPAAGMMVMAIEAAAQVADVTREILGYELRDVIIGKAIVIPADDSGTETMLALRPWRQGSRSLSSAWDEFRVFSRQNESWELNCSGLVRVKYGKDRSNIFADEDAAAKARYVEKYHQIAEDCTRTVTADAHYDHLATIGLNFSGPFRGIHGVRRGDFKSNCDLLIPDTKALMPHQYEFAHVIHPSTLDLLIQIGLAGATKVDDELFVALIPTSCERVFVSADIPSLAGTPLHGVAAIENEGFDNAQASFIVLDDKLETPWVVLDGVKSTAVRHGELGFAQAAMIRKPAAFFHWEKDVSKLGTNELSTICRSHLASTTVIDSATIKELEQAAFIYMKRVLFQCKPDEVKKFAPHFQTFYRFMQKTMVDAVQHNIPHQDSTFWMAATPSDEVDLLDRVRNSSSDGKLLCQAGEHLLAMMRGEVIPIEILMQDNCLHDYYQYGIGTEQLYAQMTQYIDLIAHKDPDMSILEIGAGTGGATLPILETIGGRKGTSPRLKHYTYTDISMGFFEKAHDKFKPWLPYMTFQKLDCSQDPVQQGFKEGDYDLVVAYNVLHATPSMDVTLQNVKRLLKPGGKLLLCEITNALLRIHVMVGAFDGWWAGEEDGRVWGPTMAQDGWDSVLKRNSFSGIDIALHDLESPKDQFYSLMVSTAAPTQVKDKLNDILVIEPSSKSAGLADFQHAFHGALDAISIPVSTQTLGSTSVDDLSRTTCVFLLDTNGNAPVLPEIDEKTFDEIRGLIMGCKQSVWLTRGATVESTNPFLNLMTGMARCIRAENPSVEFMTIDLDPNMPMDKDLNQVMQLIDAVRTANSEVRPDWEYAIRDGKILIQRIMIEKGMNDLISQMHVEPKATDRPFVEPGRAKQLHAATPGRLDTLRFIEDTQHGKPLANGEVEVEIKAVGLNFKDVMIAMGQLQEIALGLDCAGTVVRVGSEVTKFQPGDNIFTWAPGTFANFARSPESMCAKIPASLDIDTAASLPMAFSTAFYAIHHVARLRKGETVLIHGAAGGVGQAAIMFAQLIGARIFATVSSEAKKNQLIEKYAIPECDIFNSRDDDFADGIMRVTDRKGVNVVLNSLAGEALRRTWSCISWFGRFVELGQKDLESNTGLDMAPFLRNVSYHSVNLIGLFNHDLETCSEVFQAVVSMFAEQKLRPIQPLTTFPMSQVENAFRLMQTGQHIGKIVVTASPDDLVQSVPPTVKPISFSADATYILSGGLGGLGRSIAKWMISCGARNIAFLSRSGSKKAEAQATIEMCEKRGCRVLAPPCDVSDEAAVAGVLQKLSSWPAIKGVIQGAMVLQDAIYENMTHSQYMAAVRPKVQGSWNLHKLLPTDLDFFVMLSSSAGIAGSRGQGNYAAGNSFQDALANYRTLHGQHGAAIDLGMILDVGYVAESDNKEVQENTKKWAFAGIREKEVHAMIQAEIEGVSLNDQPVPKQLITGLGTGGMANLAGFKIPWWFDDSKFSHIRNVDTHQVAAESEEDTQQLQAMLSQATTLDSANEIVTIALISKIAKSLMVGVEDIEPGLPISRYGVDSLLAVEIRSWIFQEMKSDVSVFQLLSNVPISELVGVIVGKSKCVPEGLA